MPSLVDVFFVALFLVLFAQPHGLEALLSDGDTGWHIRTGDLILQTGHVPSADPFSFSRARQPWYAWEWLSDVIFALLFRWRGLAAVASAAGAVLATASAWLFARMLRQGAGLWPALAAALAAASASSIHYLARPHIFSIFLYTVALGMIERDRQNASRRLWLLIPLAALWANLHAGFGMLPATLLLAAATAPTGSRARYAVAALACGLATLANPYGWRLHEHIARYLNSAWILEHVQEFQSPSIRSEGTVVFALLLIGAVAVAWRAGKFEAALVLLWGFASMRSARHIPFFAIVAAPVVARAASDAWARQALKYSESAAGVMWGVSQGLGKRWRASVWLPVSAGVMLAFAAHGAVHFPESRFPTAAVERNGSALQSARVLTSDQWADYLIFRKYPESRVFFDGRSDFYGPAIGGDYRALLAADGRWRELLDRYGFSAALLPHDWALSTALEREPGWRLVYRDAVAVLYQRDRSAP
jgi:hypothetical protein